VIDESRVMLNGWYLGSSVGSGTVSRCIVECFPGIGVGLEQSGRSIVRSRLKPFYELGFGSRHPRADVRIHPYFAAAIDRKSILFVYDVIGNAGHPDVFHRLAAAGAGAVATISVMSRDDIMRVLGRNATVVPVYTASEFYSTPPRLSSHGGSVGRKPVIGYWSGYAPHKAWELLSDRALGSVFSIWASGSYPAESEAIRSFGRMSVRELIAHIDETDVGVFPSKAEGFGLPPLEAALRGVPLVVRRLPVYEEFLDFEKEGVFPFDHDEEFPGAVRLAVDFGRRVGPLECVRVPSLTDAQSDFRKAMTDLMDFIVAK